MGILEVVSQIFASFSTEFLISVSVILWLVYQFSSSKPKYNLPPSGSILNHIPIVGYMPFINLQTIHEDVIPKGPIVRYRLGPDDVIL